MKTVLKVTLLLGLMVVVLFALPEIVSALCGGIVGGLTMMAALTLVGFLILGLAIVGGGSAALAVLALLLALACVAIAVALPLALPFLILAALIVLPIKLVQRLSRPTVAA